MGTWNTRGLRGSTLEDLINRTNDSYREKKLALIQKIPTPITPIQIPVCFDAKECSASTFPLQNIHAHQIRFMEEFEAQGGIAFIVLYYTGMDEIYYVPFRTIKHFWDRMEAGGRKSFTYDEIDHSWRIRAHRDMLVHYLEMIARDLELREGLEDAET